MIQGAVAVGMVAPGLEFSPLPGVEQVLPGADKLSVDDALAMGQDVLGRVAVAVDAEELGYLSLIASVV